VEERNEAKLKMLNRRTRVDTENYRNKRRQAKKMCRATKKSSHDLKVLEGTKEANKRNEARKFYTIACRMKVGFQPRKSICTERDNILIGNIRMIMERRKKYIYETLNIKDDVQIREEAMYQVFKEQIEPPTKDDVREIIRTLKNNKSPGEYNISAELIKYGDKKTRDEIHAL
jgi:hypothetical protein